MPVLAMVGGVLVLVLAATLGTAERRVVSPPPSAATAGPLPAGPNAIPVAARDISVVTQIYGPGEESGWHSHSGIHAVAVSTGVLTVYDAQCQAETFEPGRPYVGGQDVHLVRNETDAPVVMSVTYLNPSTGGAPTRHVPAPAGCAA